jgi:hypothetical protein
MPPKPASTFKRTEGANILSRALIGQNQTEKQSGINSTEWITLICNKYGAELVLQIQRTEYYIS